MSDSRTSSQHPYLMLVATLGGIYLAFLGLFGLIAGKREMNWAAILIMVVGGVLLFTAFWLMRRGLLIRTPLLPRVRPDPLPGGIELEAEILARYEAGAFQGSELAKNRQGQMASWDRLELELRYVFAGREIVSRGQVSIETFFHTRGMKTLKIKILPARPEDWVALG
jgi:hypothetical protein